MLSTDQPMMTSTAVKRIKSMAIHCLKANTLAICDNDNNENGNTASSGIGIVAFCGIIRYKIAAANRKIVLPLNDLFVAMVPPPFTLFCQTMRKRTTDCAITVNQIKAILYKPLY